MPIGDILPEIVLILTAVLILVFALFSPRERQWLGAPLALTGLAIATAFCAMQIGSARLTFSGVWALDGPSIWGRLMILGATAFAVLLSPSWFRTDRRHGEYYTILLFSALGAMVLAAATDLIELVMGVLLSSVTGYTLAAYHRDWPLSVEAGMKYFLVGALANALLVIGVTLVFGLLGQSGYAGMAGVLAAGESSPLLLLGAALVVVGVAFKLGAVPAHAWMPDVAEGAPAPAAAFLTVVPKIGAAIALVRLVDLFPPESFAIRPIVALIAVATMTLGNLAALWQEDVRRLIGWSSVSQSGYALMAVCVVGLTPSAIEALLVFLLAYTVANLAAFAVVVHLRGRTALDGYQGLGTLRPGEALVLTISFFSLVGIPPLAGFLGKLMLFLATIEGGYSWLAVVAVANTVASLFYYLRVIGPMYFGDGSGKVAVVGGWAAGAVWVGVTAVIGVGIFGEVAMLPFEDLAVLP